ncbi:MAG: glycosyltransferase family 39 protein [Myxococcota bacterium]|nr:glycosyltransferase family 39 protein [Myxococcota bacterium]
MSEAEPGSSAATGASNATAAPPLRAALQDPWFVGLLAAGLTVRAVLAVFLDGRLLPQGDEGTYLAYGQLLREQGVLETGFLERPPLYFVAVALAGPTVVLRVLQAIAGAAAAFPVYRTASRVGGRRAARAACAFLLFDPTLVGYAHLVWPETFVLCAAAFVYDGVAWLGPHSTRRAVGLGLLTGLVLLLRPVFGLFCLVLAASWWLRLGLRPALRLALVFGGTAALVVSPWVIRNQLRYGPAILFENEGPYNLWVGNASESVREVTRQWKALPDPVTRSRVGMERGREAIRENPGEFLRRAVQRPLRVWGLEYFVMRHFTIGGYGEVSREAFLLAAWTIQLAWAAQLLCAAAGVSRGARDPTLRLALLHVAVFTLVVAVLVGTTRFRAGFAFPLCVTAGLGLDRLLARRVSRGDVAAVLAAASLLCVSAAKPLFRAALSGSFVGVAELGKEPWRHFRY